MNLPEWAKLVSTEELFFMSLFMSFFRTLSAMIRPDLVEVKPGHFVQMSRCSVADFDKYKDKVSY